MFTGSVLNLEETQLIEKDTFPKLCIDEYL